MLLLPLLAVGFVCHAQSVVFSASASANRIGVKDQVQITYTIQDAENLQTITPGDFGSFDLVAGPFQSNSTNMYVSGNKMVQSTTVTLTYILQPSQVGSFTIPAATARDAQGHTYRSNTVQVQVVNGSLGRPRREQQQPQRQRSQRDEYDPWGDANAMMQQMQQRMMALQQLQQQRMQQMQQMQQQYGAQQKRGDIKEELFIRATVDKSKVYVGEQVTVTYKLYTRISMDMHISKMPSLNGFWMEDIEKPGNNNEYTDEIYDGKPYHVFILKKAALFPQQSGKLQLDAAEAEGTADYTNEPVRLTSKPITIEVLPLPEEGKTASFTGAVGKFNISSSVDKTSMSTDGMANLKLTISGAGNLKLIAPPQLKLPAGLEVFEPTINDAITGRNGALTGTKTINYSIGANAAGSYDIPAIPFTYFNPQTGNYVTVYTQPARLEVSPGKQRRPGSQVLADIHGIKTEAPKKWVFNAKPLLFTPGYWSVYALPLLAFIGFAFWRGRQEDLLKDMVQFRSRTANKVALKRLANAQQFLKQQNARAFYDETSKAIWLYVSDKLNIPLSELSRARAAEALTKCGVSAGLQKDTLQLIDECETALYAPAGGATRMEQTYQNATRVISKLEENFRS